MHRRATVMPRTSLSQYMVSRAFMFSAPLHFIFWI